ncbi:MAG: zinc-ribbon domain-containing protein [Oscillochloris sp.]|nr:zinc-ribbon domain-containing protein [Oscillochloris sp.]
MTTCPTCGAQNDPGNRFCDQCGTRLEATPAASNPGLVPPDQPTVAAPVCPNCGSAVLPGEAFCDNCGADLTAIPTSVVAPPPIGADAPTMLASAPTIPASAAAAGGELRCPACGQINLPGEAFCDNCGASLSAPAPAPTPIPVANPEPAPPPIPEAAPVVESTPVPVTSPDDATILASAPPPPVEAQPVPVPVVQPDDATMVASGPVNRPVAVAPPEPIAAVPTVEPTPIVEPTSAPTPIPESAPVTPDPAAYAARKAEIEAEISRQQQIISQFEQMQAMFGATTPPAVIAGLDEARIALATAQGDLAGLVPPTPTVDPAVVKQLEDEMSRQQQIITQFEQMQAMFGAAAPPAVTTGLSEARTALAQAEADFAALTGSTPVTAVTPVAPIPAAEAGATVPASAQTPPPPPAPRLILLEGGQSLNLPIDRPEIIIGREDPVSSIFPEVDLTSFGGEAGGVSRQHAKITRRGEQWMITDLNSTNFTRIDGVRLEPYVDTPLQDGARVQFGRVVTTFRS